MVPLSAKRIWRCPECGAPGSLAEASAATTSLLRREVRHHCAGQEAPGEEGPRVAAGHINHPGRSRSLHPRLKVGRTGEGAFGGEATQPLGLGNAAETVDELAVVAEQIIA